MSKFMQGCERPLNVPVEQWREAFVSPKNFWPNQSIRQMHALHRALGALLHETRDPFSQKPVPNCAKSCDDALFQEHSQRIVKLQRKDEPVDITPRVRVGPKATYVGSNYGQSLPKLLFLSLDAGRMDYVPNLVDRTPEGQRRWHESLHMEPVNRHWIAVYRQSLCFFNSIGQFTDVGIKVTKDGTLPYACQRRPHESIVNVLPYIAHVNAAKCCANSSKMERAPAEFFGACRSYAADEVRLLTPDVIVTQGAEAAPVMLDFAPKPVEEFSEGESDVFQITIADRNALWIKSPHPSWPKYFHYGCSCGKDDWCRYASAFAHHCKPLTDV